MDKREYYNGIWERIVDKIAERKITEPEDLDRLEELESIIAGLHITEIDELTDAMIENIEIIEKLFEARR